MQELSHLSYSCVDALLLLFEAVDGGGEDVTREFSGHLANSVLCQMCDKCARERLVPAQSTSGQLLRVNEQTILGGGAEQEK
jgi:hypothetical protein